MRYGDGLLDEIRRRTNLVQVVGRRVKLTRKGNVFWGCCPFHKEKSASFKVENERRTYHCFGCGAGGDAFKWLIETEGLTFPEAVQRLAGEAGVELPEWSAEDEEREQKKKSLYDIIEIAAAFFEEQLRARAGNQARDYLKSRGLTDAICKRFRIGYAPGGNAMLIGHLIARGVSLPDIVDAGLARPATEERREARDFFFDRVMFPISDVRGRIVAFGGRGLAEDAKPKYINTGETSLFSKGKLLYNHKNAREAVSKGQPLILAEGYMDVIALSLAGLEGAVAPLGTALTEDQLSLMWRMTEEPVCCFDGDEAGLRAAKRAAHLALPHLTSGHSLKFVFLPKGEDPDSLLRSQGPSALYEALGQALPLVEMLWRGETEAKDFSTPERRAGLESALDAVVKEIKDAKIADYYRRDFSERVFKAFKQRAPQSGGYERGGQRGAYGAKGVGQRGDFRGRGQGGRGFAPSGPPPGVSAAVKASLHAVNSGGAARKIKEKEVLALALAEPELIERHAEALARFALSDPQLDRLKRELLNLAASGGRLDRTTVDNHLVRQGMGALAQGLTVQQVLAGSQDHSSVEGADLSLREDAWLQTLAQLQDPRFLANDAKGAASESFAGATPAGADLSAKREAALQRYLDGGSDTDWEELQRLNGLLREHAELGR